MKEGGVMHLQFANWRRLRAKHYWYRMVEAVRWPGRETAEQLNHKYNQALDETGIKISTCPEAWLAPVKKLTELVDLGCGSWHEDEIRRLWKTNKRAVFEGLEIPEDIIGEKVIWYRPVPVPLMPPAVLPIKTIPEPAKIAIPQLPPPAPPPPAPPPQQASHISLHLNGDRLPKLWICQTCGLVGVAPCAPKDKTQDMVKKLTDHHSRTSFGCDGSGLKLIVVENIVDERIIGKFSR